MAYGCLRDRALTFQLIKTQLCRLPPPKKGTWMVDATGRYLCVEKMKAIMEKEHRNVRTAVKISSVPVL